MKKSLFYRARRYIIVFAVVFVLALFFPPSADDLGWATSRGEELFHSGFADYNGRYLGNIFALVLTRIPVFCLAAVKAATLVAILWLLMRLSRSPSPKLFWTAATLFLFPSPLFIQGFIWTAGFSNYYLALLVTLLSAYLLVLCRHWRGIQAVARAALLILLGFAGQLFMETFTLFCLCGAVAALVWLCIKDRRFDIGAVCYLVGCIGGTVLMFSNGIYRTLLTGGQTSYQALEHQGGTLLDKLAGMIETLFGNVSLQMWLACLPAISVMVFVSVRLMHRSPSISHLVKSGIVLCYLLSLTFLTVAVALHLRANMLEYECVFYGVSLLLMSVAVGLTVACCTTPVCKRRFVVYTVLVLIFTVPLCVVFPVGPRCFSGVFALMILMIGELYTAVPSRDAQPHCRLTLFLLAVVVTLDFACYITVFTANAHKNAYIRERAEAGDTIIELPHTTLYFMIHGLDVEDRSEDFLKRYCEYYDIPQTIRIVYEV